MDTFHLSYFTVWIIVIFQACVVRTILAEALGLRDRVTRCRHVIGLPPGSVVPQFSARSSDGTRTITNKDLLGQETILMFVSSGYGARTATAHDRVIASMHGLWHKATSRLYVVCKGTEEECARLGAHDLGHPAVPILLDGKGRIASSFRITGEAPQAIVLSPSGRVVRYGYLVEESAGVHGHPESSVASVS